MNSMKLTARFGLLPLLLLGGLAACGEGGGLDPIENDGRPTTGAFFQPLPESPPQKNLFATWGDRNGVVWAVGEEGLILRWIEDGWEEFPKLTLQDLRSVWGEGPDDVYAVGSGGIILHYQIPKPLPGADPEEEPVGIWELEETPVESDLNAVAGGGGRIYAAGAGGVLLSRDEDGRWTEVESDTVENINGLFIDRQGQGVAVGNLGLLLRGDAEGQWQRQRVDGVNQALRAVWGTSASSFYAVGLDGTILRGGAEGELNPIPGAPKVFLRSVWGVSMGEAYAVGWGGTVLRLNGQRASVVKNITDHRLEGVWGRVFTDPETEESAARFYLVGVSGTVLAGP